MKYDYVKAFTLVELAIVIVKIGLLVGGVLQGKELIEQARITRTISEVENYSAAFATFYGKYDAVPGDMLKATNIWGEVAPNCTGALGTGTQTCNGNGDRKVSYDLTLNWETFRFWQHLKNAGLIKASVNGQAITGCSGVCYRGNINVPQTPMNGTIWGFWYIGNDAWGGKAVRRHVFGLGSPKVANGRWHGAAVTPETAMALDNKIDDGMPYRGSVVNMNYSHSAECTSMGNATQDANATYATGYSGVACILLIDSRFEP